MVLAARMKFASQSALLVVDALGGALVAFGDMVVVMRVLGAN
jgi:hypothetical protein